MAWKFVSLTGSEKASRLRSLASSTKTLRLGGREDDGIDEDDKNDRFDNCDQMVQRVLIACPGLDELWLLGITSLDPSFLAWGVGTLFSSFVSAEAKIFAPDIRSLHLSDVFFRYLKSSTLKDRPTWHFPHLTTLYISSITIADSSFHALASSASLLNPFALPALTTLSYTWDSEFSTPPTLTSLAPQLSSLFLSRTISPNARNPAWPLLPDLSTLTTLSHLSLDIRFVVDLEALSLIPHPLKTLRITAVRTAIEPVERALISLGADCLEEVERLEVPVANTRRSETAEARREETREWCDQRGVQLVERNAGEDLEDRVAIKWVKMVERCALSSFLLWLADFGSVSRRDMIEGT